MRPFTPCRRPHDAVRALLTMAVILPVLLGASPAGAHLTSDFDVNVGFTTIDVSIGESFAETLESASSVEFNYNLNVSSWNTALTLSFFEMVETDFGTLAFTRIAAGMRYYPLGLNGGRVIFDNEAEGRIWKTAPYAGLTLGLSNMSVDTGEKSFNAAAYELGLRVGNEVPIGADWILIGQFTYLMGMKAASETQANRDFSYTGFSLLVGFRLTSFD